MSWTDGDWYGRGGQIGEAGPEAVLPLGRKAVTLPSCGAFLRGGAHCPNLVTEGGRYCRRHAPGAFYREQNEARMCEAEKQATQLAGIFNALLDELHLLPRRRRKLRLLIARLLTHLLNVVSA